MREERIDPFKEKLKEIFEGVRWEKRCYFAEVEADKLLDAISRLMNVFGEIHLSTITATSLQDAVELSYILWVYREKKLLVVKVRVLKKEPRVASLVSLIPGALLYEGEAHDLVGVMFEGNPLMDGHVLLSDDIPEGDKPLAR